MTIAEWMEKEREKGIDFGRRLGMSKGRREGIKDGLRQGLDAGRREGIKDGLRQGLDAGRKDGLRQGLNEGQRHATRKIAQAMLANGIDIEIIAKTTGLTRAEIETLA